jgi:hypothetical protein
MTLMLPIFVMEIPPLHSSLSNNDFELKKIVIHQPRFPDVPEITGLVNKIVVSASGEALSWASSSSPPSSVTEISSPSPSTSTISSSASSSSAQATMRLPEMLYYSKTCLRQKVNKVETCSM